MLGESKWIHVYVNGDENSIGLKYCLNKQTKSFATLLNNLSEKLQPKFGAVRTIYDLQNGKKVFSLQELKQSHKYAAAGVEALRRCEKWFQEHSQNQLRNQRKSQNHSLPIKSTFASSSITRNKNYLTSSKSSNDPVTIFVYRNGEFKSEPTRFNFNKQQLIFWDRILQSINQKVLPEVTYIRNGFRLCSLNGHVLNVADELSDGQTCVAVGNFETFRRRKYLPVPWEKNTAKAVVPETPLFKKSVNYHQSSAVTVIRVPEPEYEKDFEEYVEDDEEEEEEPDDDAHEVVELEDDAEEVVKAYSDDAFEEEEEEPVVSVLPAEGAVRAPKQELPVHLNYTADTDDEGFHSGPCSSTREVTEPPIFASSLPEIAKPAATDPFSPEMSDLDSIRHSYMGFYDSPLPTYHNNSTSKAVVAVGSGNRRPSFYYSATTQTFRRTSLANSDTQAEIDKKLRLEADPNNIFHAKGENAMTRHALEIQETNDTLVDLPVDFWEAHEVLEEIPEDPPPEMEDQNSTSNKRRSSTFAY